MFAVQPTTTTYAVQDNSLVAVTLETTYAKLPQQYKEDVDKFFENYKKPSREYLSEISAWKDKPLAEISESIRSSNVLLLKNENKQAIIRTGLSALRDEAMQISLETRKAGHSCLDEIRQHGAGRLRKTDHSSKFQPNEFFLASFSRLAKKLETFSREALHIERQIASMQALAVRKRDSVKDGGAYGEIPKIGVHEILRVIKTQHEAFLVVTAKIAECHREAQLLREAFKKQYPSYANVFDEEDRREIADMRIANARVKEQFREHLLHDNSKTSISNATASANMTGSATNSNAFYSTVSSNQNSSNTGSSNLGAFGLGNSGAPNSSTSIFNTTNNLSSTNVFGTNTFGTSVNASAFGAGGNMNGFGTGGFGGNNPTISTSAGDLANIPVMTRSQSTTFGTTNPSSKSSKSRGRNK